MCVCTLNSCCEQIPTGNEKQKDRMCLHIINVEAIISYRTIVGKQSYLFIFSIYENSLS